MSLETFLNLIYNNYGTIIGALLSTSALFSYVIYKLMDVEKETPRRTKIGEILAGCVLALIAAIILISGLKAFNADYTLGIIFVAITSIAIYLLDYIISEEKANQIASSSLQRL